MHKSDKILFLKAFRLAVTVKYKYLCIINPALQHDKLLIYNDANAGKLMRKYLTAILNMSQYHVS